MPPEAAPAGAPAGGEDPMMQILQVAMQAVQSNNCEAALAVCQALVQLAQGGAGGSAPEEAAPAEAPAEEPVYARYGARLIRRR